MRGGAQLLVVLLAVLLVVGLVIVRALWLLGILVAAAVPAARARAAIGVLLAVGGVLAVGGGRRLLGLRVGGDLGGVGQAQGQEEEQALHGRRKKKIVGWKM